MPPPRTVVMRRGWLYPLTVLAWWWLMMAVHELGHVLGCLFTGATIEAVILWPWTISETVRSGSSAPLIDTWAGPVVGVLLPVLIWLGSRRWRYAWWTGGWAGFCLVANGIYLGVGWIDEVGDAGDLLHLGMPVGLLAAVGSLGLVGGLWIWHVQVDRHRRAERNAV
jgi:hypothetical protein